MEPRFWDPVWMLSGLAAWATLVATQTLTPTNFTNAAVQNVSYIELTIDVDTASGGYGSTNLLAATNVPLNMSRQGNSLFVNNTNELDQSSSSSVAYVNCETQQGFITNADILNVLFSNNTAAVILYSTTSDYCSLTDYTPGYPFIYSLNSAYTSNTLLDIFAKFDAGSPANIWSYIAPNNVSGVAADIHNCTNFCNGGGGGGGGAPTTAIAMIILYTVTGIITLLFLSIIVTGAVRAHRHPERYGLRPGVGRPRRSRAQGLARAMLDSLPIVKFGEREDAEQNKPNDIELGNTSRDSTGVNTSDAANTEHATDSAGAQDPASAQSHTDPSSEQSSSSPSAAAETSGIAAAAGTGDVKQSSSADVQGCSICTEDFERGQDQRVLPCDHRFHPACIDPWLLNVSGTCPLCRIDLNPRRASEDGGDEGNDHMAPPLDVHDHDPAASQRLSIRRSIIVGLMGVGGRRPENMSREERVSALRQLRRRNQTDDQQRRADLDAVAATPEEEHRLRTRLRNVFNVRSRRTGRSNDDDENNSTNDHDDDNTAGNSPTVANNEESSSPNSTAR